MEVALWVVQVALALVFGASGSIKLVQPRLRLASRMAWVEDFSDTQVKGIGALELLAAIGLIAPAALGMAAFLIPFAAAGLVLLMIGAGLTHVRRSEMQAIATNFVLGALALLVAWARLGPYHL